jgi:hypothetical protein
MESIKRSPEHLSVKTQSPRRGNPIRQDSLRTLREFKKVQGGISGWEVSAMQGGPDDEQIASLLRRVQSTSAGAGGGPASSRLGAVETDLVCSDRLGLGDAADEQVYYFVLGDTQVYGVKNLGGEALLLVEGALRANENQPVALECGILWSACDTGASAPGASPLSPSAIEERRKTVRISAIATRCLTALCNDIICSVHSTVY